MIVTSPHENWKKEKAKGEEKSRKLLNLSNLHIRVFISNLSTTPLSSPKWNYHAKKYVLMF